MSSCKGISSCATITALIECLPSMYQGTDYTFEIQLFDEEGFPLDLTEYSSILLHLYTNGYSYADYKWELTEDDIENRIFPLEILQYEDTSGQVDKGFISFKISSELSARFLTGPILGEIKFKKESEVTGGLPEYTTIACLNIGTVKQSLTKNVKF